MNLQRQGNTGRLAAAFTEAQLVQRIGRIGNEFTQKDFAIGIERIGENAQNLAHLSLELLFLNTVFGHNAAS